MCGFAGFYAPGKFSADSPTQVQDMAERLKHRGPDHDGHWTDPDLQIAVAFRRLAIMDLSESGNQPMLSPDGSLVLAFNGEIYNHEDLRKELQLNGIQFRGHSDTEVLLAGISAWGLESALTRCVGMFAFALIDRPRKKLFLARDRIGEKPLYYGWSQGHFFFGSELKAFRPHPGFAPQVDPQALTLYLRLGYVPAPFCILGGFRKLMPGHILSLDLNGSALPGAETSRPYWRLPQPGTPVWFRGTPQDCIEHLDGLLRDSIRMQMLADVPVGAFLSGGIDSSSVVAFMQAQASSPVKTFTIGFPGSPLDESRHAENVARHLGTDHTTWMCTEPEVLNLATRLPQVYCEPFADDSQLPTLALAILTRKQVTVSLSGDGGDELFHGYGRYAKTVERWEQLRRHAAIGLTWRCGIAGAASILRLLADSPLKQKYRLLLLRAERQWLPDNLSVFYRYRMSRFKAPEPFLCRPELVQDCFDTVGGIHTLPQDVSLLSYLDLITYLPDDLLVKVDRATMAVGLEGRLPLLDHRIVEFALTLPPELKSHSGKSKWPLRALLARQVPPELTERPKMGFDTPMPRWLRGPLRDWAEALLSDSALRQEGFFDSREVRRLWRQHLDGTRDRSLMLWSVLMFQAWQKDFMPTGSRNCAVPSNCETVLNSH